MNNLELMRSLELNRALIADHRKAIARATKQANKLAALAIQLHDASIKLLSVVQALDANETYANDADSCSVPFCSLPKDHLKDALID